MTCTCIVSKKKIVQLSTQKSRLHGEMTSASCDAQRACTPKSYVAGSCYRLASCKLWRLITDSIRSRIRALFCPHLYLYLDCGLCVLSPRCFLHHNDSVDYSCCSMLQLASRFSWVASVPASSGANRLNSSVSPGYWLLLCCSFILSLHALD